METETEATKKICVAPATYKSLETLAANKNMSVEEYVEFLFKSATTFDAQPEQNDPSIEVPLTAEQYAKLRAWIDAKGFIEIVTGTGREKATLINSRQLWRKNHPQEKQVWGGEVIELKVPLFSPYVEFLKDYLTFFGSKDQLETLCMKIIYQKAGDLHRELTQFAENKVHLLEGSEWYWKHSHVADTNGQLEDADEKDP
jgi:hypothetical protein